MLLLVSREQRSRMLQTSYNTQDSPPHNEELLAQNVKSAEAEIF